MLTARDRALLYDAHHQFAGAIVFNGRRTGGIPWMPGAYFPNLIEHDLKTAEPIVLTKQRDAARIAVQVCHVSRQMLEGRDGNH
jgi:hypothetical protein